MKAILEFNLPDDQYEYYRVNKAGNMSSSLWDVAQYLREQRKYAEKPDNIDKIYERFYEILNENDVDLDKIIQ